ncbi:hypothetical protein ElyMa_004591300 [Elysia marginata]|uniref:Uncharacterized protein n=1 Tax=Elysia marginata TaxID=1093978 RepID=A0AAV4HVT8_9GAST|nr:hypothetical protein ElyMa_004591300 [Elysia marginata]
MGNIADDILSVIRLDESRTSYQETPTTLDSYFNRTPSSQGPVFNRRVWQPSESADPFIQDFFSRRMQLPYYLERSFGTALFFKGRVPSFEQGYSLEPQS